MRFVVRHLTHYSYSAPVRLGAHLLRLTPRPDAGHLVVRRLDIDPLPVFRTQEIDSFGNSVTRLDFAGETTHLRIESRIELETRLPQPAQGSLPPLPWPARARPAPPADPAVATFAAALRDEAAGDAGLFLTLLTRRLFEQTDRHIRPDGAAQSPGDTLRTRRGACRDLTVLFQAVCATVGLPCRFVSGYQARAETPDGQRHLHAWPEVALPGAGWTGFDPTHGQPVAGGHLALAAAPDQAATMPVEGGFWGAGVGATLRYSVEIETAP